MKRTRRSLLKQTGLLLSAASLTPALADDDDEPALPDLPDVLLPYLQNPSSTAMSVCWLARGADSAVVKVAKEGGEKEVEFAAVSRAVPGTPWMMWKARVQPLQAGVRYRYRVRTVRAGEATESAGYSFRALDPGARSVKAAIFNDIHNRLPTLEALLARVQPSDFEFSIFNGDMINDPSAANGAEVVIRLWNDYVRLLEGSSKPILFVRGNHEVRGSFQKHLAWLFDLPTLRADAPEAEQEWQYSLTAGPVHFVMMDTGEDDSPDTDPDSYKRPRFWEAYRRKQTAWLERHLATPIVREARHRVFLSHIPLHNPAGWYSIVSRDEWSARLASAGFDLMLAGHDHSWKFVPAGKEFTIGKGPKTDTATLPVIIGGGPSMKEGTIILLHGDVLSGLSTRMIAAEDGKTLHEWEKGA